MGVSAKKCISVLLLEDNVNDAELVRATLAAQGFTVDLARVDSREAFESALQTGTPDLIISDYSLPGYDGKSALAAARQFRPDAPFVFYSGTIGEESAIDALKLGATDYVLKDKPKRLISAIERALGDAEQKRKHREADEKIAAQAQLLDLASDAIIVRDLNDRVQFWNQGAERLYGFTRTEVVGHRSTDFIPPAAHDLFREAKRLTLERGEWQGEMEHLSKERKRIVVMSRWTIVRNPHGEPERILAINSDITHKKDLEKQFLRAQRLESIGTLASGIAHDLNNILAPILMACEVIKDVQPTPDAAEMVDMAMKSAQRGAGVVNQLLTFIRGSDGKLTLVQTATLLTDICSVLKKTMPKNIVTRCEIDPALSPIKADTTQMHQVLMNLCINARDAMPNGGTLAVSARNASDSFVLIRVEDTGTGIPPEIVDKIFDPFFTTKEPGKGTGLGLSTVVGIVKSHEGTVKVESHEGAGTVFEIMLPACSASQGLAHESAS